MCDKITKRAALRLSTLYETHPIKSIMSDKIPSLKGSVDFCFYNNLKDIKHRKNPAANLEKEQKDMFKHLAPEQFIPYSNENKPGHRMEDCLKNNIIMRTRDKLPKKSEKFEE